MIGTAKLTISLVEYDISKILDENKAVFDELAAVLADTLEKQCYAENTRWLANLKTNDNIGKPIS